MCAGVNMGPRHGGELAIVAAAIERFRRCGDYQRHVSGIIGWELRVVVLANEFLLAFIPAFCRSITGRLGCCKSSFLTPCLRIYPRHQWCSAAIIRRVRMDLFPPE